MRSEAEERWFRLRLRATLHGWAEEGLLDRATLGVLIARIAEQAAAPVAPDVVAPPVVAQVEVIPPVVEAVDPYDLPALPHADRGGWSAVGGFLRERTGWVLGVALTVIGSLYVAGTVWGALSATWRQVLVVGFLGLYAVGFRAVAARVGRVEGGAAAKAWLELVVVALGPVQAMAAGSLASVGALPALLGLVGVGALQAWLLRGLFSARFLACWLPLSLSVGLVPLAGGVGLTVAVALLACGALVVATGERGPRDARPAVLCGGVVAFHGLLGEASLAVLAPLFALAGLSALYLDVARARWRGVHGVRPQALPGLFAVGLGLAGAACTLPGFTPLPTGATSAVAWAVLVVLFGGAALAWRRAVLVHLALAAALFAVLCAPDLFRAVIAPLTEQARHALGYASTPLPLAWYSLTLLPFVIACRFVETLPRAAGWKQARELARTIHHFTLGLSAALLLLAHTRPGDLRPALLALPVYAALAFREKRLRDALGGALVPGLLAIWILDALGSGFVELQVAVPLAGAALVALPHAFRFLGERTGSEAPAQGSEWVSIGAAVLMPVVVLLGASSFWTLMDRALTLGTALMVSGVVLLVRDLDGAPRRGLAALGLALVVLGSPRILWPAGEAWAAPLALALAVVAVATECVWDRWRRPLTVAAHIWAGGAIVAATLVLDDPARGLVKLPVALMALRWAWLARSHPGADAYGVLLALGFGEALGRRAFEAHGVPWGATAAVLGAWVPAAMVFGPKALRERVGWPAAVVGGLAAVLAVGLHGWEGTASSLAALPLILVPLLVPLGGGVQAFGGCLALGLAAVALPTTWGLAIAAGAWAAVAAWLGGRERLAVASLGALLAVGAGLALDPVWDGWVLVATGAGALLVLAGRDRRLSEAAWATLLAVPTLLGARLGVEVGLLAGAALAAALAAVPRHAHPLVAGLDRVVRVALPLAVAAWALRLAVAPGEGQLVVLVPVALLALVGFRVSWLCVRALAPVVAAAVLWRLGAPDEAWPVVAVALAGAAVFGPSAEGTLEDRRAWGAFGLVLAGLALFEIALPLPLSLLAWVGVAGVLWRTGWWWAVLPLVPGALDALETDPWCLALLAAVTWQLGARRAALFGAFLSAQAFAFTTFDAAGGVPALVAAGLFVFALEQDAWSRRIGRLLLAGVVFVCVADAGVVGGAALVALFVPAVAEARQRRWWWALGWAGSAYVVARLSGPLIGLPPSAELALLLLAALGLETLRHLLDEQHPALRRAAAWLPGVGLALVLEGGGGPWALAAVGVWHGVRFVARSQVRDVVVSAVLLDVASVWTAARLGFDDPLVFVGPVALSLGAVAHLLRGSVDRRLVDALRVLAAGSLYVTAFGVSLDDPVRSLHLLVLALLGVGLGAVTRVRAYLLGGLGAATAAVLSNLIRFGLDHSQFWAFYLTALGLSILGLMVALTLHRERFDTWMGQVRGVLSTWE